MAEMKMFRPCLFDNCVHYFEEPLEKLGVIDDDCLICWNFTRINNRKEKK